MTVEGTIDPLVQKRALFRRLLEEHGDKIYSFAFSLAGNEADASDLVAEAFAKALKSLERFDETKAFHSWLFKIVQNIYIDRKRRLDRRMTLSLEDELETREGPTKAMDREISKEPALDARLAAGEAQIMVRRALDHVPAIFREPMMLADMMAMDYDRISKQLGVPVGTVRSRIFRGRSIFREKIRPYAERGGAV